MGKTRKRSLKFGQFPNVSCLFTVFFCENVFKQILVGVNFLKDPQNITIYNGPTRVWPGLSTRLKNLWERDNELFQSEQQLWG